MTRLLWLPLVAAMASRAAAEAPDIGADCYDAVVEGKILRQTPSVVPDTDDGSIVMVWPWFLDLDVNKVVSGPVSAGRLAVISMQHTGFRKMLGPRRWWLRRNKLGGFNLLRFAEADGLPRCSPYTGLAEPLIRPASGQTLEALRNEAERAYHVER